MNYYGYIIYFDQFVKLYSVKLIDIVPPALNAFINPYLRPEELYIWEEKNAKIVR